MISIKTKWHIIKKIMEVENQITRLSKENPYENGAPIQSEYYQTLLRLRATADALIWTIEENKKEDENKNTKVISGFPAVGKSYIHRGYRNIEEFTVLDSDSSEFSWLEKGVRHPDFPNNYMQHIKENIGKADIIFVSSHDNVRQALQQNNIDYTLVYPDTSLKDIYIKRYKKRGSNEGFIKFISTNWEAFISDMDKETFPTKIKLLKDEYLVEMIYDILL